MAIFTFILMLLTVLEFLIARRLPSDPFLNETPREADGRRRWLLPQMGFGTTIGNPGFRDGGGAGIHTNGISMTDSSVRFVSSASNPTNSMSRLALARQLSSPQYQKTPPNHNNSHSHSSRAKVKSSSKSKNGGSSNKAKSQSNTNPNNSHDHWNGSVTSLSPASNGSSASSVSTVSTLASTITSNPRGLPLRSSLKKSKPATPTEDGFGIQNPGFSGTSPTLSRTGSLKKVRIQTQSTDV